MAGDRGTGQLDCTRIIKIIYNLPMSVGTKVNIVVESAISSLSNAMIEMGNAYMSRGMSDPGTWRGLRYRFLISTKLERVTSMVRMWLDDPSASVSVTFHESRENFDLMLYSRGRSASGCVSLKYLSLSLYPGPVVSGMLVDLAEAIKEGSEC